MSRMRLLNVESLELEDLTSPNTGPLPKYVILSHRRRHDDVDFKAYVEHDKDALTSKIKTARLIDFKGGRGLDKVLGACLLVRLRYRDAHDLLSVKHLWVDSCCINKYDAFEASVAIKSMYAWYSNAEECIAFLYDFAGSFKSFQDSEWHGRGWTLQELLAPPQLQFYNSHWESIGDRAYWSRAITARTGIDASYLKGHGEFRKASIATRMSWLARRETTIAEDIAYCALGIFGAFIHVNYGEGGEIAFRRLQVAIINGEENDDSIFAWESPTLSQYGLLAPSPSCFAKSTDITKGIVKGTTHWTDLNGWTGRVGYIANGQRVEYYLPSALPDHGSGADWNNFIARRRTEYIIRLNCMIPRLRRQETVTIKLQKVQGVWRRVNCSHLESSTKPPSTTDKGILRVGVGSRPAQIPHQVNTDPVRSHSPEVGGVRSRRARISRQVDRDPLRSYPSRLRRQQVSAAVHQAEGEVGVMVRSHEANVAQQQTLVESRGLTEPADQASQQSIGQAYRAHDQDEDAVSPNEPMTAMREQVLISPTIDVADSVDGPLDATSVELVLKAENALKILPEESEGKSCVTLKHSPSFRPTTEGEPVASEANVYIEPLSEDVHDTGSAIVHTAGGLPGGSSTSSRSDKAMSERSDAAGEETVRRASSARSARSPYSEMRGSRHLKLVSTSAPRSKPIPTHLSHTDQSFAAVPRPHPPGTKGSSPAQSGSSAQVRQVSPSEERVATALASNEEFANLCKQALTVMGKPQLVKNLHCLLKGYHLSLLHSEGSDSPKKAAELIRWGRARRRIAQAIMRRIHPEPTNRAWLAQEKIETASSSMDDWVNATIQMGPVEPDILVPQPAESGLLDSSSGSESDEVFNDGDVADATDLGALDITGTPFQRLLLAMQLLLIPSSVKPLSRVLMTIPTERITFMESCRQSIADRVKAQLQQLSSCEWDWWPLIQCRTALPPGQTRMHWQCHCKRNLWQDVPNSRAIQIRYLLRLQGTHLRTNHLCLGKRMPNWRFSNLVLPSAVHPNATLPSRVIAVVTSTNNAPGQSASTSQPSPRSGSPAYSNSSAYKNNSTSGSSINTSSPGTSLTVGSQHSQSASVAVADPNHNYITYGVGDPSALDVDHLCTVNQAPNDSVLFTLLRRNYISMTGLVKAMFSIWQLSHYDFIKVRPPTFSSVA